MEPKDNQFIGQFITVSLLGILPRVSRPPRDAHAEAAETSPLIQRKNLLIFL